MNDQHFMQMALDLAIKGEGFTSPNPMVGAVVVKDGKVVGNGFHEIVGGPHAEVNAIDAAGKLAAGATLFVTLEPCNHTGRTPPCTQKILDAGANIHVPGCSLCMGNQAQVMANSTVFSTSTRNFNNRMGAGAQVYLGSAHVGAMSRDWI